MKTLLLFSMFTMIISASQQIMVDSSIQLHSYNHRLSIQLKQGNLMKKLANIDSEKARQIATDRCGEPAKTCKLTHKGQLLFYRIFTKRCKVYINALDGSVISKRKL